MQQYSPAPKKVRVEAEAADVSTKTAPVSELEQLCPIFQSFKVAIKTLFIPDLVCPSAY